VHEFTSLKKLTWPKMRTALADFGHFPGMFCVSRFFIFWFLATQLITRTLSADLLSTDRWRCHARSGCTRWL